MDQEGEIARFEIHFDAFPDRDALGAWCIPLVGGLEISDEIHARAPIRRLQNPEHDVLDPVRD